MNYLYNQMASISDALIAGGKINFFPFLAVLQFELRALSLLGLCALPLEPHASPFCSDYL
jgi:hypothetical protein